ncbi:D-alanyl-D-alanine carboxypeptidase/D-alanyl-D-alanine endopeptidase [Halopseudomonas salegens]|uniref:D-alanyl-D-alanine carboxypeptidase / D-alanyl-D-alanine-endopeptidase (Penicillin-binding protein 4) n=1 Tax=Halopseudomonas salegens TaxID=1434072 RepID=A0A1H2FCH9_9GAMM|nr:D-alanyl-D-alanine carboxypeptidase/D-alanyl-D-alanine-endopeptidase [Halopseudomonas salegens]SDU05096.1 D-alanyl-D-alanine carboxypeptidase / D-alanyl-D-alanine-endopeptidase (penicillin-binding protein 4) [Halopseudomonas salegens]
MPVSRTLLRCLLPITGLLLLAPCVSADNSALQLPEAVNQALSNAQVPANALSLAVIPLEGQGLAQFVNAEQVVNPASTMKLLTTFAALELLGPDYQWHTELLSNAEIRNGILHGDLIFRSSGDPKLTQERVWLLLRELRAAGVVEVRGDLVLQPADLRMPADAVPFRDDGNDQSRPFLVEPDPLLSNLKLFNLSTHAESSGIRTHLEPALPEIHIDNQVRKLPPVSNCPWPNIAYNLDDQNSRATLTLTGSLHQGCSAQRYFSALDAATYTASLLRVTWHELGGKITGNNRIGSQPAGARRLASNSSPDLVSVVRDINKFSNNTMARQLLLTIGRENRTAADADDHKAAVRAIEAWLASKNIQPKGLVIDNGSGLSRIERITARDMALLLEAAWKSPFAAEFISSMPLAAMDGTMRRRLHNTPLVGEAHVKTGSLRNVRAIAGITRDGNGKSWAVSAIVNHGAAGSSRRALDLVLQDVHRRTATDVAIQ